MMFTIPIIMMVAAQALEHVRVQQANRAYLLFMCETPEQRTELLRRWEAERLAEKAAWEAGREEREKERRHQELCEAIENSRPRGIGLFF